VGSEYFVVSQAAIPNAPLAALNGAKVDCTGTPLEVIWPAGTVWLWGPPIVPRSTYGVSHCNVGGTSCSTELVVSTSEYGDVVGAFGLPPDYPGQPNFGDISSMVDKFRNLASAPHTPRTDIIGSGVPPGPSTVNQNTNFGDISAAVDSFRGFLFPFGGCP
jgi:hypothetical protein